VANLFTIPFTMMQRLSRQSAGAIREDGQRNGPEDVSLEGTGGGPGDKRRGSNTHLGLRSGPSCPGREEGDMGGGGLCGRD